MSKKNRIERDVLGELEIPEEAYWEINTQRAIENFKISGKKFPSSFIKSLAKVKKACTKTNLSLNCIEEKKANAIIEACDEIIFEDKLLDQFPIDIFQTGSGTQTNMNMNEVLANRANEILGFPKGQKKPVHPNDDVNLSQSSNDIIPTTMHLVSLELLYKKLFPALKTIIEVLQNKIEEFEGIVKVGRTHLQDAVPIPLSLEFSVYLKQLKDSLENLEKVSKKVQILSIGGTALGTGIGSSEKFSSLVITNLSKISGFKLDSNPIKAEGIASHSQIVSLSSSLRILALALTKMANDIRLMGSGPRAGFGELILPQNEPGSSIMPGKINPTQIEMLIQVCLRVLGNDTTITASEMQGSIMDLNVTKPLMISVIIESIELLSKGIESFTINCLKNIKPNLKILNELNEKNLMVITKVASKIGYDKAASLAKEAYETDKNIRELLEEKSELSEKEIEKLLDPHNMV